jgi:hypothetical protein
VFEKTHDGVGESVYISVIPLDEKTHDGVGESVYISVIPLEVHGYELSPQSWLY